MKKSGRWLGALAAVAFLGGCTVGEDYKEPQIETPDAWHNAIMQEAPDEPSAPIQAWWEIFNDPVLNELIEQARESNLTAEAALVSVREARARLAFTGAQNLPEVGARARASSTKLSDNGALSQVAPPGGFKSQGMMVFGLDAAWEIDVFGRIRREVEAESARYEASVESYRDVLVSLYAEVALAYIEIRSSQAHIAKATQNIDAQTKSLDLTEERFRDGLTSALDIEQAKSNLYATQAAIPMFRIRMNQAYNRLTVLCGKDIDELQTMIGDTGVMPQPAMNLSVGVPADLLRQRPDVRRAEREIAAATAMIGAATAELYPRFALKGSIGLESRSASSLFDSSSVVWTAAAPIHWNIFTAGRTLDNIEIKKEETEKAILNYRNTVLEAMEEVENALVSINEYRTRFSLLNNATSATDMAVELVTTQYENGLTDFNNVLDMQRALYEQQTRLVSSQTDSMNSIVALYKALGGGWLSVTETDIIEDAVNVQ
ncbi:efflux transporter outer membrane subunit [Cerasicoccus fimbriatus]|uniref:efflux transporter outer membrane subunit n=1 Tax=Cerasicoccus fimbriatus TaxID=3014554 RepID=UPI0022B4D359|nr:efflux transporter outer membrane subunit [Cerasicoccus sp. TK19100]